MVFSYGFSYGVCIHNLRSTDLGILGASNKIFHQVTLSYTNDILFHIFKILNCFVFVIFYLIFVLKLFLHSVNSLQFMLLDLENCIKKIWKPLKMSLYVLKSRKCLMDIVLVLKKKP